VASQRGAEGGYRLARDPDSITIADVIRALEHNCWDVHRHGEAGSQCYFVEAGVTDESVQS